MNLTYQHRTGISSLQTEWQLVRMEKRETMELMVLRVSGRKESGCSNYYILNTQSHNRTIAIETNNHVPYPRWINRYPIANAILKKVIGRLARYEVWTTKAVEMNILGLNKTTSTSTSTPYVGWISSYYFFVCFDLPSINLIIWVVKITNTQNISPVFDF